MPMPTPAQVESIIDRLREAVTNGTHEPTAILSADEHRQMLDLHINDAMAAGVMLQHLREHARTLAGDQAWRRGDINRISFRIYETGARDHRTRQAAIDAASNIVRLAAQTPRQQRQRNQGVHSETGDMDAASMIQSDSIRLQALGLLLLQRQGRVWLDTFHKRALCDWSGDSNGDVIVARAIDDAFIGRVTTWLHIINPKLAKLSEQNVMQIVLTFARLDQRSEPRDWLQAQVWDGEARLAVLMVRGFGARDTAFNREAGRCWIISMVARIMEAGAKVDTMPVFIGGQGLFKSQALEVIGAQWYRAASSGIDSQNFLQELHGALVFEIPELHSIVSGRHGTAKVKAVLSTRIDHFRLPYGRLPEDHARTAVMAGTTNNRDWHSDETGARRFWPVHVGRIDLGWLREWRGQLFAEALMYYQGAIDARAVAESEGGLNGTYPIDHDAIARGQWWNVPEAEQAELMAAETATHAWHEIIETRLASELARNALFHDVRSHTLTPWDGTTTESTEWGNGLTVTRIGVAWLGCTPETLGRGTGNAKIISGIMRTLGWEVFRPRIAGSTVRPRVFVRNGPEIEGEVAAVESVVAVVAQYEDDIPF